MTMRRIICPPNDIPQKDRVDLILEQFKNWIESPLLGELITKYNGGIKLNAGSSTIEKIHILQSWAAEHWDFRKVAKAEDRGLHWKVEQTEFAEKNKDLIYQTAKDLGLIGIDQPVLKKADYIFILGGGRLSNLKRTQASRLIADTFKYPAKIVALTSMRQITDSEEQRVVDSYAPNCRTEFDVMNTALESVYGVDSFDEKRAENEDHNLTHIVRKYSGEKEIYSLAAPSSRANIGKSANTSDGYKYAFDYFGITCCAKQNAQMVSCTSQIYVPQQHIRGLFFALQHNCVMDCVGFPFNFDELLKSAPDSVSSSTSYIQEIKATLDAIADFCNCFANQN